MASMDILAVGGAVPCDVVSDCFGSERLSSITRRPVRQEQTAQRPLPFQVLIGEDSEAGGGRHEEALVVVPLIILQS